MQQTDTNTAGSTKGHCGYTSILIRTDVGSPNRRKVGEELARAHAHTHKRVDGARLRSWEHPGPTSRPPPPCAQGGEACHWGSPRGDARGDAPVGRAPVMSIVGEGDEARGMTR